MARLGAGLVWLIFLGVAASDDAPVSAKPASGSQSQVVMSEDARRMHERLLSLSRGEGSTSELRIEFMDGGMVAHRSFSVEAGKLVSKEWKSPGSPMIHREGSVTDSRVLHLLQQLMAKKYWNFEGTRFVPDAPIFLFRFFYGDLPYVDFRCDSEELRESGERVAIRDLFLGFVSETEMTTVSAKQ